MRNNRSLKSKSTTPIRLPHDGPIFHLYCQQQQQPQQQQQQLGVQGISENENSDAVPFSIKSENATSSLHLAVEILFLADVSTTTNTISTTTSTSTSTTTATANNKAIEQDSLLILIQNTVRSLMAVNITLKDQLQTIQAFKSTLLNWKSRKVLSVDDNDDDNNDNVSSDTTDVAENNNTIDNHNIHEALYRLFLEWSLSSKTTLPLQRALHSSLKALEVGEDRRLLIAQDVLSSLWTTTTIEESQWQDPLHVLDVAINTPFLCLVLTTCNDAASTSSPASTSVSSVTSLFNGTISFIYRRWIADMLAIKEDKYQQQQQNQKEEITNCDKTLSSLPTASISTGLLLLKLLKILFVQQNRNNRGSQERQRMTTMLNIPFRDKLEQFVIQLMDTPELPTEGFNTLGIVFAHLHLHDEDKATATEAAILPEEVATKAIRTVVRLNQKDLLKSSLGRLSVIQGIAATVEPSILILNISNKDNKDNNYTSVLASCWESSLTVSQTATDPLLRWAALKGLSTLVNRWKLCVDMEMASTQQEQQFDTLIQATLDVVLQAWENPPLRKLSTSIPGIFRALVEFLSNSQRHELCRVVINQPRSRKGRYLAINALLPYLSDEEVLDFVRGDSLLQGIGDRGPNAGAIVDLWIKLLLRIWTTGNERMNIDEWTSLWVLPLSKSLVLGDLNRRKQIASFCISRLMDAITSTAPLKAHLSEMILTFLTTIGQSQTLSVGTMINQESVEDRILWAQLESLRLLHSNNVLSMAMNESIVRVLPKARLEQALAHELPYIRLVGFQSLDALMVAFSPDTRYEDEGNIWKKYLPLSMRTTKNKEHTSLILQGFITFLDRLMIDEGTNKKDISEGHVLPRFFEYVNGFVVTELILSQGLYPGTVSPKEEIFLQLLEQILAFVLQNESFLNEKMGGSGPVFGRKRSTIEVVTMQCILESTLLQREVFASLFSLLYTQWDGTRALSFRVLSKLTLAAHSRKLSIPDEYACESALHKMKCRGMYLACSPRQRESNNGSRLLAFVYISLDSAEKRDKYLSELVDCLESRLSTMQQALEDILGGLCDGEMVVQRGQHLPLVHGIILAITLIVRNRQLVRSDTTKDPFRGIKDEMYSRLLEIFSKAIQMSLRIVADVNVGESVEGMEESLQTTKSEKSSATPLNVNTGAIGANGSVSRLTKSSLERDNLKKATQRVIVGTWLLTKETCASASAVIASSDYVPSRELVSRIGTLLISTMTSLKHAGAAFAARDSLQEISAVCLSSKNDSLQSIPESWVNRLNSAITSLTSVRDSTLRRSTGYALGYQAMMRGFLSKQSEMKGILRCENILKMLVQYALPPDSKLRESLSSLDMLKDSNTEISELFVACSAANKTEFAVADEKYEMRSRVHALNILRMIILDASLTKVVAPFIGDAMIAALLGYDDEVWAVRNSATMVFSASMLRVIDSDKNASNKDDTSSQAITMTELFRRYPSLTVFLPALVGRCVLNQEARINSQLFPLLLLISRAQPQSHSGGGTVTSNYGPLILNALKNRDHAIRDAAARSLVNIHTVENNDTSSAQSMLLWSKDILDVAHEQVKDWNSVEGALVLIRSLVSFSPTSISSMLREFGLVSKLYCIAGGGPPLFPPTCIAAAIDSLKVIEGMQKRSRLLSLSINLAANPRLILLPGGIILCNSLANTIVELNAIIWHSSDMVELDTALQSLLTIFSSESLDMRIMSIKAFKKRICQNIDELIVRKKCANSATKTLLKIAEMLAVCVSKEVERCSYFVGERVIEGPHAPTLRRLSRCFLECFDAIESLQKTTATIFIGYIETNCERIWSMAVKMVHFERFLDKSSTSFDGETVLSGNSAEMMAIEIRSKNDSGILDDEQMQEFVTLLCRLNSPLVSWRSRYSAARAIESSHLLGIRKAYEGRDSIIYELLKMLQDTDPDVNRCAVRSSKQLLEKEKNMIGSGLPTVTLCRLSTTLFGADYNKNQPTKTINRILHLIMNSSHDVIAVLEALQADLEHSKKVTDPWKLTNSGTSRDIFEEEERNPNNEKLLSNHLAVQTLLTFQTCEGLKFEGKEVQDILDCTVAILSLLKHDCCNTAGDITHDVSRFPAVFPALHGVLGGCTAAIYLGLYDADDLKNLQDMAKTLERAEIENPTMHPKIYSILKCMAQAKKGDTKTNQDLRKCLFLLKEDQHF